MTIPTFADVESAAKQIAGVAHKTPVATSRTIDARTGARVFFKCENLQRAGAFKFRGAYNALSRLTADERGRGVVTFSSGNHAQAIALAGQVLNIPPVIVMPTDAPAVKRIATEGYGGEIVPYDRDRGDREAIGRTLALERGLTIIPPYDHPDIVAGAGTAALELIREVRDLDFLLVPCAGGGQARRHHPERRQRRLLAGRSMDRTGLTRAAWAIAIAIAVLAGPPEGGPYVRAVSAQQDEPSSPRAAAPLTILQINDVYST